VYNGELKWTTPKKSEECGDHYCCEDTCEEVHGVVDTRSDTYDLVKNAVYLPHSCDEWVIGGIEQVKKLIVDLEIWLETQEEVAPLKVLADQEHSCSVHTGGETRAPFLG